MFRILTKANYYSILRHLLTDLISCILQSNFGDIF